MGALLVRLLPSLSIITQNLTSAVGFNFEIVSFALRLNVSAIVGMVIGVVLFLKA
jgi:hypothetical protein